MSFREPRACSSGETLRLREELPLFSPLIFELRISLTFSSFGRDDHEPIITEIDFNSQGLEGLIRNKKNSC